jgi:hypothetical protein
LTSPALEANTLDIAIALERASKAFLLTGDPEILIKAEEVSQRLSGAGQIIALPDLERLKQELKIFVGQGRSALAAAGA